MIVVSSALKKDEIKAALADTQDPTFTFEKEQGLNIFFKTDADDLDAAADSAKSAIKEKVGKEIMFSVKPA